MRWNPSLRALFLQLSHTYEFDLGDLSTCQITKAHTKRQTTGQREPESLTWLTICLFENLMNETG